MIELGDKVKCIYSGFTGIVVAKLEFINGCIQYEVLPKIKKDGSMPEGVMIDENSLRIISAPKKKPKKNNTGGPMHKGFYTNSRRY